MSHLFHPSEDLDPPYGNPIADKPFAKGQRREYLGRRVFTTRKGEPQPIDVWRAWCTSPTCSRSFKVTAFHGHDPEPAPAVCRYCIWLAKLAGRKATVAKTTHSGDSYYSVAAIARAADNAVGPLRIAKGTFYGANSETVFMTRKPKVVSMPPPKPRVVHTLAPRAPFRFIQAMLFKRRLRSMVVGDKVSLSGSEMAERWRRRRREAEGQPPHSKPKA